MRRLLPGWFAALLALLPPMAGDLLAAVPLEPPPQLEISGFGDVCRVQAAGASHTTLGQFEIGLSTQAESYIGVDAAIAWSGEAFEVGAFTVDFRLLGQGDDYARPSRRVRAAGVVVGQFDAPFGIDWQVYPSIDRDLVSGPLVVAGMHDSWNDVGAHAYVAGRRATADLYVTNGFEVGSVEPRWAVGSRLGWRPGAGMSVGLSAAGLLDGQSDVGAWLVGADLSLDTEPARLRAEAIRRQNRTDERTAEGYYLEALVRGLPVDVVTRVGRFDEDGGDEQARWTQGLSWNLSPGCTVRAEHQFNRNADNISLLQVVVGF